MITEEDRSENHIHIAPRRHHENDFMDDHKDSIVQTYCAHTKPPKVTGMTVLVSSVLCLVIGIAIGVFLL